MSWTLNASGHCASEEDERGLVAELNRVLSAAKAGTFTSGFVGAHHRGAAHGLPGKSSARRGASGSNEE